ncbi:M23 family metallopeptidase [Pseudokineococcus lusitanus]|jgi:murein DD-endopeptidase MepM/ murein hydrolase activator NlpD|uniref:Peptidase M23-like protein n=1 Tax=Pseudokineococcus lusitanus TaxID=763993 RepID=A0A3N1HRD3_9ACTN|nr:M23 family metallopeptidase [Pseudokineococcus lusitanus]ROP45057.1 peptidase M23-like protein [Pseudokineococcus lusitanus]
MTSRHATPTAPRTARRAAAGAARASRRRRALAVTGLSVLAALAAGTAHAADGELVTPASGRVTGIVGGHCSTPGDGHGGVDVAAPTGTKVIAAAAGVVSIAGTQAGSESYGTFVRIHHGSRDRTIYAHLSAVAVAPGQEVLPGQTIGYVGSTGRSSGPHLHFEYRHDNVRQTSINAGFTCRKDVAMCTVIPGVQLAGEPTSVPLSVMAAPELADTRPDAVHALGTDDAHDHEGGVDPLTD